MDINDELEVAYEYNCITVRTVRSMNQVSYLYQVISNKLTKVNDFWIW